MNYNRTMRVNVGNKGLINAISSAVEFNDGNWNMEGEPCSIVDIVRIERTNYVEVRLLSKTINGRV